MAWAKAGVWARTGVRAVRWARLDRRLLAVERAARREVWHRVEVREHAAACAAIRAALPGAKIDPDAVACLRMFDRAERDLAALHDTPARRAADAAFIAADPRLAARPSPSAKARLLMPRYAGGTPPPLNAALTEWFAWALQNDGPTL